MEQEVGIKYDNEKLRYNLMPEGVIEQEIRVMMFGAKKYEIDNWKRVEDWRRRYVEAAKRHLIAYENGEEYDKESGLHHLAHARCCLAFLLWKSTNKGIYIAGPMRGYANHNFHEFFKWEVILNYHGWVVYNPARMSYELCQKLGKNLDQIPYEEYLKQDLETIRNKCTSLFVLEYWEHSPGANREVSLAKELNLNIYYEKDGIPIPKIGAIY